ncbi:hypothetical protein CBA19CS11_35645 [Caballeronia novacaledonica]|uniref:ATP-binding protein n=1 Tax=Caballeronia novacaledonica TaxID=1544861 RepID=UPI001EE30E21|nr:ATP-binding protein [Caballeronia novacaledonica]GJH14289.1 hypothetical protein CBA19CS11_35645 [Caballeronia novacaledonica]
MWLSNSVTELDPAFVRRFDLVLHMPVPPARQRERIFREACSNRLSDAAAHRMSIHADLTPGVVARAAGVLGEIADHLLPARYSDTLETLVSGTLEAQGHAPLSSIGVAPFGPDYALDYVNADCDLFALAQGITREQSARLCLDGPPGTGKTAFAAWLAQRMDRALMTRRASDLFSPYVGGTEQNLARAFEEALRDNAVLCLDEGDNFLRERTLSQRSWEVTGVNEMLSQMERFPGVLIVSTNLPDMLDEAALRRFDLKIRFGPLQTAQRRAYFTGRCRALGLEDDADASAAQAFERLDRLDALTLGDFAAVLRRHRMYPLRSASEFVQALAAECALKHRGTAPIGFR